MAERLNALPWKGSIRVTVSGVRIPLSPLVENSTRKGAIFLSGERIKRGALYVGIRSCCEIV